MISRLARIALSAPLILGIFTSSSQAKETDAEREYEVHLKSARKNNSAESPIANEGWNLNPELIKFDPDQYNLSGRSNSSSGSIIQTSLMSSPEYLSAADEESDEISNLACSLQYDPLKILEWVRNNIDFEPYFGLKRGARLTLLDRMGNDFDQCALLMALLKAHAAPRPYEASYRYAIVEVDLVRGDGEDAVHWLKMAASSIKNKLKLVGLMGTGDQPAGDKVRVRRVWINLAQNGQNYVLDPAFKQYTIPEILSITESTNYNFDTFWTDAGGSDDPNYVQYMDVDGIRSRLSGLARQMYAHIRSARHTDDPSVLAGAAQIKFVRLRALPVALSAAHTIVSEIQSWDGVPEEHSMQLLFSVGGAALPSTYKYTAQLRGKKLYVWFQNRRAQIWLNDTLIVEEPEGTDTTGAAPMSLQIIHSATAQGVDHTVNRQIDRGNACLSLVYSFGGSASKNAEAERAQQSLISTGSATDRLLLSQELYITGSQWALSNSNSTQIYNTARRHAGFTDFSAIFLTQKDTVTIDIPSHIVYSWYLPDNPLYGPRGTYVLGSFFSSGCEHSVVERATGVPGYSAAKLLEMALKDNKKVFNLRANTFSNYESQLQDYTSAFGANFNSTMASALSNTENAWSRLVLPETASLTMPQAATSAGGYFLMQESNERSLNISAVISGSLYGGRGFFLSILDSAKNAARRVVGAIIRSLTPSTVQRTTSSDPVDLATGAFLYTESDISLGDSLTFARHYNSAASNQDFAGLGRGWTHNYNIKLAFRDQNEGDLSRSSAADIVPMAVAAQVLRDLWAQKISDFANEPAKAWALAAIVVNWALDQQANTKVSIIIGDRTIEFTRLPDGGFEPQGNVAATLEETVGGGHILAFRHSDIIYFDSDGRWTKIVDAVGKELTATYADTPGCLLHQPGGGPLNLGRPAPPSRLERVQDPYGRWIEFDYDDSITTSSARGLVIVQQVNNLYAYWNPNPWDPDYYVYQVYTFGSRISAVRDSTGRSIAFDRSVANDLTVTDVEQKAHTLSHDLMGRLTKVMDARGRTVVDNFYDAEGKVFKQHILGVGPGEQDPVGNMVKIGVAPGIGVEVDPLGNSSWTYFDRRGRRMLSVDQLGNETVFQYDGSDRLARTILPSGVETELRYHPSHQLASELRYARNAEGTRVLTSKRIVTLDAQERPETVTALFAAANEAASAPAGTVLTTYTYFENTLLPTSVTRTGGITSTYDYYSAGQHRGRLWRHHPAHYATGAYDIYAYDSNGHIDTIERPRGGVDDYTYSIRGDLLDVTDRSGIRASYGYNSRRQVTSLTQWRKNTDGSYAIEAVTYRAYDDVGELKRVTDPSGRVALIDFNALGDLLTAKAGPLDGNGNPTVTVMTRKYDKRQLLESVKDALNSEITYLYDAAGRLKEAIDPLQRRSVFEYDADSRLKVARSPLGVGALNGSPADTTYGRFFEYQHVQFKTVIKDPSGDEMSTVYEANGRIKTFTNRRGKVYTWDYDDANRKVTTITPLGKDSVVTLDARGLPLSYKKPSDQASSPSVTFSEYYDDGLLKTRLDGLGETTYTYWPNGQPKEVVDATGSTYREFDSLGRLKKYRFIHAPGSELNYELTYDYYPSGELKEIVYPGTIGKVTYTYDDFGRLWTVTDWSNRTTVYAYWADGRVHTISRHNGTLREQSYDTAGQLRFIRESKNGLLFLFKELQYDDDGRIKTGFLYPQIPPVSDVDFSGTYDDDNRLETYNGNGTLIAHDDDGNMTHGPLPTGSFGVYVYDARNRLTSAGGSSYGYNPDGLRVEITGTGAASFVIDPNAKLSRTLIRRKGNVTTYYVYGLDLLYEEAGGITKHYHSDQVGSTLAMTDNTGHVTDRWNYSASGSECCIIGTTDTPFRFNGGLGVQTDTNGLLYMRARYYNARIMRFLNSDPIGFGGGVNWYAFTRNDPISFADPLGLKDSRKTNVSVGLLEILDNDCPAPNSEAGQVGSLTAYDIAKAALSGVTIKGGADIGYYAGSSATVSRPVTDGTGGKAAVDATIGGGAIAYAGFEGDIPLFESGDGQSFSFGGTIAAALAIGGSLELEIRQQPLFTIFGTEVGIRVFVPTSIKPFIGIGFGGILKLESPTPSATLLEVNVDQSGNTTTGGLLGGRQP